MSAMDHNPTSGWGGLHDKRCVYCHEPWPCPVAKTRRELAGYLRQTLQGPDGPDTHEWDWSDVETIPSSCADAIDYKEN